MEIDVVIPTLDENSDDFKDTFNSTLCARATWERKKGIGNRVIILKALNALPMFLILRAIE